MHQFSSLVINHNGQLPNPVMIFYCLPLWIYLHVIRLIMKLQKRECGNLRTGVGAVGGGSDAREVTGASAAGGGSGARALSGAGRAGGGSGAREVTGAGAVGGASGTRGNSSAAKGNGPGAVHAFLLAFMLSAMSLISTRPDIPLP